MGSQQNKKILQKNDLWCGTRQKELESKKHAKKVYDVLKSHVIFYNHTTEGL